MPHWAQAQCGILVNTQSSYLENLGAGRRVGMPISKDSRAASGTVAAVYLSRRSDAKADDRGDNRGLHSTVHDSRE
jgi:hypothetical protein